MIPANSLVIKCPHCGGKKELLQLVSGNTCGAELWSDAKHIAPMLPRVSPVQKCPKCGHYYLMSRISNSAQSEGDSCSFNTGWLSFNDALEANQDIESPSNDELSTLAIITVWAYNDIIRHGEEPTEVQKSKFIDFVTNLLANQDLFADNLILLGELNREIGKYDECISILSDYQSSDDYADTVVKSIIEKAKAQENKVFKLQ